VKLGEYTLEIDDEVGPFGYAHYTVRDTSGKQIAGGGISRLNYRSKRAHIAAIRLTAEAAIRKATEGKP